MSTNIEIKATVDDLDRLRPCAARLAAQPARILEQEDVFFNTNRGRLKLRCFPDGTGELIQYERPDTPDAKQSDYRIFPTDQPAELRAALAAALGETITVKKTRELYLVGQTRIHLDEVAGLGPFVELEVVLRDGQTPEQGRAIAAELMTALDIRQDALVPCAYADLLCERTAPPLHTTRGSEIG